MFVMSEIQIMDQVGQTLTDMPGCIPQVIDPRWQQR